MSQYFNIERKGSNRYVVTWENKTPIFNHASLTKVMALALEVTCANEIEVVLWSYRQPQHRNIIISYSTWEQNSSLGFLEGLTGVVVQNQEHAKTLQQEFEKIRMWNLLNQ